MALIPQQLLFLDPPQRKLPEEGLRHKGDKGDEGLLMENRQTTTGTLPTRPPPPPPHPPSNTNASAHLHTENPWSTLSQPPGVVKTSLAFSCRGCETVH